MTAEAGARPGLSSSARSPRGPRPRPALAAMAFALLVLAFMPGAIAGNADITPPALDATAPPTVAGTSLVLTYDEVLDQTSTPAASAFEVTVAGVARTLAASGPVVVSGRIVTLTLSSAVAADETATVSYTVPDANPVRDPAGNAAAGLTARAVTNATLAAPADFSALGDNGLLDLSWDAPAPGADIARHEYRHRALPDGTWPDTWTTIPASAPGGTNEAGYRVTGLTDGTTYEVQLRVANDRDAGAAAEVSAVVKTRLLARFERRQRANRELQDPHQPIRSVGFVRMVLKTGVVPQGLTEDDFEVIGGRFLLFEIRGTVIDTSVQGDADATELTIVLREDAIDNPGGNVAQRMTYAALGPPGATISTDATEPVTGPFDIVLDFNGPLALETGETEIDSFKFSDDVVFTNASHLWHSGVVPDTTQIRVRVAPRADFEGELTVQMPAHGYYFSDDLRDYNVAAIPLRLRVDTKVPKVASVAVTSTPTAARDTYNAGEEIEFTVTFSETVEVSESRPHLEFALGPSGDSTTREAAYRSGAGTAALVFAYTVVATDMDPDGISVGGTAIELDTDEYIRSASDMQHAALRHTGPGRQAGHKVDGSLVRGVPVVSIAAVERRVTEGTAARFEVTRVGLLGPLTVAVSVTETGSTIDGTAPAQAVFEENVASVILTVPTDDDAVDEAHSTVSAAVEAGTGYTRGSSATAGVLVRDDDARVDFSFPPRTFGVPVGWDLIPSELIVDDVFRLLIVTSTEHAATASDIAAYDATVRNNVRNTGHSAIRAFAGEFRIVGCTSAVNADDHTATTYSAADPGVSIYWLDGHNVADDYRDFYDGTWDSNAPTLPAGTGTPSTVASSQTFTGCGASGRRHVNYPLGSDDVAFGNPRLHGLELVNGSANRWSPRRFYGLSPLFRITGVPFVSTAAIGSTAPGGDGVYETGDAVRVTVTFSEAVTVDISGGTPRLALTVGERTRHAVYSAADSTATALVFAYTVEAQDRDRDGISFAGDALMPNGGAIHRRGDTAVVAATALRALSGGEMHRVNHLAAPAGFEATAGEGEVALSWTVPTATGITGHEYRQKTDGDYGMWTAIADSAPGGANEAGFTVENLGNGTAYTFQLRALAGFGDGDPGAEESATPMAPISIAPDRPKATAGHDYIHYTLTRGRPTTEAVTVTVTFEAPPGNDWELQDTDLSYQVTFGATEATATLSVNLNAGLNSIGFKEDAEFDGPLTARLGVIPGYDTADTAEVEVVTVSKPRWVAKPVPPPLGFAEGGGAQDVEIEICAASPDMPAPSLSSRDIASLAAVVEIGPGTASSPGDYLANEETVQFPTSVFSANADGVQCGRATATFTPVPDGVAEGDETVVLILTSPLFVPPGSLAFESPDGTLATGATDYPVTLLDDDFGVVSVAVTSTPGASADTYGAGDEIRFTVTFSRPATVTGTPHFEFKLGPTATEVTKEAAYQSGSGTKELVFAYTVLAADMDSDGVSVLAGDGSNTFGFDTGEHIRDAGRDAVLTHAALDAQTGHKVDGSMSPLGAPSAPVGLVAEADGTSRIDLSWAAPSSMGVSEIAGYRVERSADGGSGWTEIEDDTGTTDTTYSDTGLAKKTTRHYRVSAKNATATGAPSNVAHATTLASLPGAPTGLTATAGRPATPDGTAIVRLAWTAPTETGDTAISGYRIERSVDGNDPWTEAAADTGNTEVEYVDSGLGSEVTRHYRVSARNGDGAGPPSNVDEATTADVANPVLVGAATAVGGSSLVLTYDETLDTGSTPGADAFTVKVTPDGGRAAERGLATTDPVRVGGRKATLTLASPVAYGDTVTVSYAAPTGVGAAPIRDESQNNAGALTDRSVENGLLSDDATLSGLSLGTGVAFSPAFRSGTTAYRAFLGNGISSVTVTATRSQSGATVAIAGNTETSTPDTARLPLSPGRNTVTVTVTAANGVATETYTVAVVRAAAAPMADPDALLTANLTVGDTSGRLGYFELVEDNEGAISANEFRVYDRDYMLDALFAMGGSSIGPFNADRVYACFRATGPPDAVRDLLHLRIGGFAFSFAESTRAPSPLNCHGWTRPTGLSWAVGDIAPVRIEKTPELTGATVDGAFLVLSYDKNLDTGSEPLNYPLLSQLHF